MPSWISNLKDRVRKERLATGKVVDYQQQVDVPEAVKPLSEPAGLIVEAWLDRKAEELNGDWVFVRLAGFSRGDEATARQVAAATLRPTEELRVEADPENLYSATAVRVCTVDGTELGYLEHIAAERISRQMRSGNLVRCFVYSVTLNDQGLPSSVMLALMS